MWRTVTAGFVTSNVWVGGREQTDRGVVILEDQPEHICFVVRPLSFGGRQTTF